MIKAVFVDYTGTIIQEKGADLEKLVAEFVKNSDMKSAEEAQSWWYSNLHTLEKNSLGDAFIDEDEMCYRILKKAEQEHRLRADLEHMHTLNQNFWMYAPLFDDVEEFLRMIPLPVYIVTNNGSSYVNVCLKRNHLHVHGVISANDARACKPNKELFEKALEVTGFDKSEVLYVGDSIESDIACAKAAGVEAVLLDRKSNHRDAHCRRVRSLIEVITLLQ